MMPRIWLEDNRFIAGRTKSGKSYFFEHSILPNLMKNDGRQIILLDFKDQYNIGQQIPVQNIDSPMKLAKIMTGEYTKGKKIKLLNIKTGKFTPDHIEMVFRYLNNCRNKVLVMEEASFFFRKFNSKNVPPECDLFMRCGTGNHNKNHNIILITQFPNDIPGNVLDAFNDGHLFFLPPRALTYLHHTNFLMVKPDIVFRKIAPLGCYRHFEVGKDDVNQLLGSPQDKSAQKGDRIVSSIPQL